jgi:germacradienol/geosmin synthase
MHLYELPDFYVPYPARLNPYLDSARPHINEWAREIGILAALPDAPGTDIWDECKFVFMDLPLLCAYTNPAAPNHELDLVGDNFFEVYKRSRGQLSAKEYLDRLPAFMPVNLTDTAPEPVNSVERGGAPWSAVSYATFTNAIFSYYKETKQDGICPRPLARLHQASIGRLMVLAHSITGRHLGMARR